MQNIYSCYLIDTLEYIVFTHWNSVYLYINDFRYMNWYTKSKSTIIQPQSLDAKQLRRKEIRSQSIPHNLRRNSVTNLPEVNLPSPLEDDTESGNR